MAASVNRILAYSYRSEITEDAKIALQARIHSLQADCKRDGNSYIADVIQGQSGLASKSDYTFIFKFDTVESMRYMVEQDPVYQAVHADILNSSEDIFISAFENGMF
ncbi:hypothetical protein FIBSPDRAFT_1014795 [Athelia psychrophila]|uniref:Stress-response A/B barrel domain-containing protein n=1 Tax=Athelia psychrophila TaxID=1759441 RepID=A0A166LYM1_9AGAM|nr:hypothetical protein FIBSPDRAFT_1014795 [Fibularhizoctonia sp. CBS 109695]